MNKKFAPILLIVILAALAVGLTYWRGQSQPALPSNQPISDVQNQATQPPPILDTAPVSTGDTKLFNPDIKIPFAFEMPVNWHGVVDYGEGILGGAAGPTQDSVFRIALDEIPIVIAGRGGIYPIVAYQVNEKAKSNYMQEFSVKGVQSISIPGAEKAIKKIVNDPMVGDLIFIYLKRDNDIFVIRYLPTKTEAANILLNTLKFN